MEASVRYSWKIKIGNLRQECTRGGGATLLERAGSKEAGLVRIYRWDRKGPLRRSDLREQEEQRPARRSTHGANNV